MLHAGGTACPAEGSADFAKSITDDADLLKEARAGRMVLSRAFMHYTALSSTSPGECDEAMLHAKTFDRCCGALASSVTYTTAAPTLLKTDGSRFTKEEVKMHAAPRPAAFQKLWKLLVSVCFPLDSSYREDALNSVHTQALIYIAIDTVGDSIL